jgi:hypothetical protein
LIERLDTVAPRCIFAAAIVAKEDRVDLVEWLGAERARCLSEIRDLVASGGLAIGLLAFHKSAGQLIASLRLGPGCEDDGRAGCQLENAARVIMEVLRENGFPAQRIRPERN